MSKNKNNKKYKQILSWLAVILWMALIFYLSSQPVNDSNRLSNKVTESIIVIIEKVTPRFQLDINMMNHIVRKNAHFFAYLVLGILMNNAIRLNGVQGFKGILLALVICILYAISDEVHQLFVSGRSGQVKDVLIDSAGAIGGIGLYLVILRFTLDNKQMF